MEEIGRLLKAGWTAEGAYEYVREHFRQCSERMKKRGQFIRENCKEYEAQTIERAKQYMDGKMVLCGTMGKPYFVGNPPKWKENPLGDNEFVWQLNRMEHWETLIQAYYLTDEESFAQKVLQELEDWIDTCPPPEIVLDYKTAKERFSAVHPWRSLEIGIRGFGSWNKCLEYLSGNAGFTLELFKKMVKSFHDHGQILYQVCPIIWPEANHNHYIMECLGLLEISGMIPFLKVSDTWKEHGIRELERCVRNQITADGGQIEGCPTYHNECLRLLGHSLAMEKKYGISFSEEYRKKIESMFMYSVYASRPDGNCVPWGDSDASPHVFEAAFQMYLAIGTKDAFQMCVNLFSKELLLKEFYRHIWEVEDPKQLWEELGQLECRTSQEYPEQIFWAKHMKQAMMRTSWTEEAASLFFACRTPVYNDHAHIDPNGFDYCCCGVPVLTDAGRYNYQEGMNRRLFKGGTYHNTLLVNQKNAFEYLGSWAYGPQKEGTIRNAGNVGDVFYVCGSHRNYEPVIHTRMVIMQENYLIVLDRAEHRNQQDTVDIYYNFNTANAENNPVTHRIRGKTGACLVQAVYSQNLSCECLKGRASSHIDFAWETTMLHMTNTDQSELFGTVFVTGKRENQLDLISLDEWEAGAEICFRINGIEFQYRWNYETDEIVRRT